MVPDDRDSSTGRLFAVGDVHGSDTALCVLLARIEPQPDDVIVFLGDLVDRGPGTKQVLDQILDLRRRCRVVLIQGNHEEMMLRALHGERESLWLQVGGDEALESYGGALRHVPQSHVVLLESCVDYWESPAAIFVHANLQPGVPLNKQLETWLRWHHISGHERWYDPPRRTICGHTPQAEGLPLVFPGWVCLDTDCQRGGWLTALDVAADWIYQANEAGQTRDFVLGGRP